MIKYRYWMISSVRLLTAIAKIMFGSWDLKVEEVPDDVC